MGRRMNEDRKEYLDGLADEYGVDIEVVYCLADVLGESEDYDGLVSELQDISYMGGF